MRRHPTTSRQPTPSRHPTPSRRRGLTLAELIIALAMLGVIALATSSFTLAVAAGWRSGDDAFRLANLGGRSGYRVQDVMGKMLYVLQASPATTPGTRSYLFFWEADGITGLADGKAQLGEMALLEYDPALNAISLYEPIATAAMTAAQLTAASASDWGDPTAASVVTYYKGLDFVGARQTVIGGQSGASTVTAASFGFGATTGNKPIATYSIQLKQGASTTTSEGSIVLHTATVPRNLN